MGHGESTAAVLFDVGGTLFECRPGAPEVYANVLTRLGGPVTAEEVGRAGVQRVWSELTQLHPRGLDRYHGFKGNERSGGASSCAAFSPSWDTRRGGSRRFGS